jgi:hypothetical protein
MSQSLRPSAARRELTIPRDANFKRLDGKTANIAHSRDKIPKVKTQWVFIKMSVIFHKKLSDILSKCQLDFTKTQ